MLGSEDRRTNNRRVEGITLSSCDLPKSNLSYCGIPSGSYCSESNIAKQFSNRTVEEITHQRPTENFIPDTKSCVDRLGFFGSSMPLRSDAINQNAAPTPIEALPWYCRARLRNREF